MKIIAQGAEAIIYQNKTKIVKDRIPKKYRIDELDNKLRRLRTRAEFRNLERASTIIPVPVAANPGAGRMIHMEFIPGKKLSENLESLPLSVYKEIGSSLAKLHDSGIIHGDLTTSNLIFHEKEKRVYFIDFGLSFHSNKIEDKAVDLHLINQALKAKHPKLHEQAFKTILQGYKRSKDYSKTLKQLKKVEARGRYKKSS